MIIGEGSSVYGYNTLKHMDFITIWIQSLRPMPSNIWWSGGQLQKGLQFTSEQSIPLLSSHYLRLVNERILQKHFDHRSWGCRVLSLTKCWLSREAEGDGLVAYEGGEAEEVPLALEETQIEH
jgi:hypothetical protein